MIISASRPYFAPFPGFFYQANLCDMFIILDTVPFPRGTTWITRNRLKFDLLFNCGPKAREILISD